MEIRNKSQAHQKQNEATQLEKERFQKDISAQMMKLDRAQDQYGANYNNVIQVKGSQFEESAENQEIQAIVEDQKTQQLLNALSVIINEFPALGHVIKGSFGDELEIPSRPESAIERPITGASQRSGVRMNQQ